MADDVSEDKASSKSNTPLTPTWLPEYPEGTEPVSTEKRGTQDQNRAVLARSGQDGNIKPFLRSGEVNTAKDFTSQVIKSSPKPKK